MELLLSVRSRHETRDVRVEVDPSTTIAELAQALADPRVSRSTTDSLWRWSDGTYLESNSTVSSVGLVSGEVMGLEPPEVHDVDDLSGLRLAVTSGHAAGRSRPLVAGELSVGRSERDCDWVIPGDRQISSKQFTIAAAEGEGATITPNPAATNPLRLNGSLMSERFMLGAGDVISAGQSSFTLRGRENSAPTRRDAFGTVAFTRTPYFRDSADEVRLDAVDVPIRPKNRRFNFIAMIAPLIFGVGMALALGSNRYLLFACMSPMVALATWIDQRWISGKEYREEVARFELALAARSHEIDSLITAERLSRQTAAPDIEELAFRARFRQKELWVRGRDVDDFLVLRVGSGTVRARIAIDEASEGEHQHVVALETVERRARFLDDVPILVDLKKLETLAIVGSDIDASALAGALTLQAACLHSPEDLIILSALTESRGVDEWLKWLPHTRSPNSPLDGAHLSTDSGSAGLLLRSLAEIVEGRLAHSDRSLDRRWPWLVVLLDADAGLDAGVVSRLLEGGAEAGVSAIWLCADESEVPRQATAVVRCDEMPGRLAQIRYTDPEQASVDLDQERVGAEVARDVALSLASFRDASAAKAASAIPTVVPLLDAFGVPELTPDWIEARWRRNRFVYALPATLGVGDAGPFSIDLVTHGPHGLIGGTSGSGKSELLQSLLAGLVINNGPDRLNLLFIDYKGGALSKRFEGLPHTVGSVTNLDSLLAQRALVSLTAELNHRMRVLGDDKLSGLIEDGAGHAPASLVIVIDEFAALVREMPEFVDGVVSIAERGRSLGIHLLLSTQRPSGAINENIQQNTNLRIALRMLDSGESNNVIGTADAALIPTPLKGRALARLGAGQLIPFQASWSEAPLHDPSGRRVTVRPFTAGGAGRKERHGAAEGHTGLDETQLAHALSTVQQIGAHRGRSPWKDPLPRVVPLTLVAPRPAQRDVVGRIIPVGLVDDPALQDQYVASVDLEQGALMLVGGASSGKSSTLITAASASAVADADCGGTGFGIVALDFASRSLTRLTSLPQTISVASGDELEEVTRTIAYLENEMRSRRSSDRNTEHPPVLVLIDGWSNLTAMLHQVGGGGAELQQWYDVVVNVVRRGREVGMYTMIASAERPRSDVLNSIAHRLILRQTGESEYRELGVPARIARGLELLPGQALDANGRLVQIATLDSPNAGDVFDALCTAIKGKVAEHPSRSRPLPIHLAMDAEVGARGGHSMALGASDLSHRVLELAVEGPHMGIAGPPGSGRTNVLRILGHQLEAMGVPTMVVGPPSSPLSADSWSHGHFGSAKSLVAELSEGDDGPKVILFDDLDLLDVRELHQPIESLMAKGVRFIAVLDSIRRPGSLNPLVNALKEMRLALLLRATDPEIMQLTGTKGSVRRGLDMPVGRAVLLSNRTAAVVQTFHACAFNLSHSTKTQEK